LSQEPKDGFPLIKLPEFIMSRAEPWIGESAVIEWIKAMSSTQVPTLGKRSETHFPHSPY
jgi:hypothetical protein